MSRKKSRFLVPLILLSALWPLHHATAIDGDMQYSAPYVIFDPETGKLVTVNPGPTPKAHPQEPAAGTPQTAAPEIQTAAPQAAIRTDAGLRGEPDTRLLLIVALFCLLMAAGGFFIWKTGRAGVG